MDNLKLELYKNGFSTINTIHSNEFSIMIKDRLLANVYKDGFTIQDENVDKNLIEILENYFEFMHNYKSIKVVGDNIVSIELDNGVKLILTYPEYELLMNHNEYDEELSFIDTITDTGVYTAIYSETEYTDDKPELLSFKHERIA